MKQLATIFFLCLLITGMAFPQTVITAKSGRAEVISGAEAQVVGIINFGFAGPTSDGAFGDVASSDATLSGCEICNVVRAPAGTQVPSEITFQGEGLFNGGSATGSCYGSDATARLVGEIDINGPDITLPQGATTQITVPVSLRGSVSCCTLSNPETGACNSDFYTTININGPGVETINFDNTNGIYTFTDAEVVLNTIKQDTKCHINATLVYINKKLQYRLSAHVTPTSAALSVPTGNVTFWDSAYSEIVLGKAALANEKASINVHLDSEPNPQWVKVVYKGDGNFNGCESPYFAIFQ
jgi:hypothetical protein